MSDTFRVDLPKNLSSIIKVIGVGGGGGNAVNYMFNKGIEGVDFLICNTDSQALATSPIPNKIQIGTNLTEGLGAGSDPEVGKQCALESIEQIEEALRHNTKMVFITAGMGGGTGTGAAPVIAKIAKDRGLLTVGIVTTPFKNEGPHRNEQAAKGLAELRPHVDALLIITNDRILQMYHNLRYSEAFSKADDVLCTAAKGIAEIITVPGRMNVDFRDVRTAMLNSGRAIMGTGVSEDDDRALAASQIALDSPLLDDTNIEGAKHILLNIGYEKEEPYSNEIDQIISFFQNAAGQNAILKFGITKTEGLGNSLAVTVIATGFEKTNALSDEIEEDFIAIDSDELESISIDLSDSIPENEIEEEIKPMFDRSFEFEENPSLFKVNGPLHNDEHGFGFKRDAGQPNTGVLESNLDVPAYKRLGIELEEVSEEKTMHKLYLEEKDGEVKFKETGNKFLNKNVD